MLIVIYLFNVIAVGYIIYALERAYGTCMDYNDVVWMMVSWFQKNTYSHKSELISLLRT